METMIVKNTNNDNNQPRKTAWYIILAAVLLTLANIGVYQCSKADKPTETITTDTVYTSDTIEVTDTFCYFQPQYKLEYVERWDTLYTKDTVSVPIPMKRVQYEDSVVKDNGATVLWYASVSGYEPSLDTLDFSVSYPQITNTEYVTTTIEKTIQKPAPRFSFGPSIGIGYGLTSKQFDAYAGVSLTYRF